MIPTMPGRLYTVVGRFDPDDDAMKYRAATMPDAPFRWTPAEAEADERRWTDGDC